MTENRLSRLKKSSPKDQHRLPRGRSHVKVDKTIPPKKNVRSNERQEHCETANCKDGGRDAERSSGVGGSGRRPVSPPTPEGARRGGKEGIHGWQRIVVDTLVESSILVGYRRRGLVVPRVSRSTIWVLQNLVKR